MVQSLRHVQRSFAEDRGLSEIVPEVREEELVGVRVRALRCQTGNCRESRCTNALAVIALRLGVERADEPFRAVATLREPHLLRKDLRLRPSSNGESRVYTLSGMPMLPPTMLAYSAPPSRVTLMSRDVYDVTDVRRAGPKS